MDNAMTEKVNTVEKGRDEKKQFAPIIRKYVDLLNTQMDTFPIVYSTMAAKIHASATRLQGFINKKSVKTIIDDGKKKYSVPIDEGKNFERLMTDTEHSINAIKLYPKNTVVAFVSLYDAFLSELLECVYDVKPELLNASTKEFSYSDVMSFNSFENLKKYVIEKEVETTIRESHKKQLDILAGKLGMKLTEDLPILDDFIEVTERRNLFVHTNGKVSSQYLKTCDSWCKKNNVEVKYGEEISASLDYVEHCYYVLFEMGLKLGQVIWRKLEKDIESADNELIDISYDLMKNNKPQLANVILEFASKPYVKHYNQEIECVICINRALSYYMIDNIEECKSILLNKDWSAADVKFRFAKNVLLEKYDDAIKNMHEMGDTASAKFAYNDWPLLNKFRKTEKFKKTYKEIFKCEFEYHEEVPTGWKDIIKEVSANIEKKANKKTSKDKLAKTKKEPQKKK